MSKETSNEAPKPEMTVMRSYNDRDTFSVSSYRTKGRCADVFIFGIRPNVINVNQLLIPSFMNGVTTEEIEAEVRSFLQAEKLNGLRQCLAKLGWTIWEDEQPVLGNKLFDTAVGKKKATLWLYPADKLTGVSVIRGTYESEGSNILSTLYVPLQLNQHPSTFMGLMEQAVGEAEYRISGSYAARLLKLEQSTH